MTILPAMRRPCDYRAPLLLWRHDRPSVLELDPGYLPGAARRAAAQWIDGHPQLVTGLDARAVPPIAQKEARRAALQEPDGTGAVLGLHVEKDVDVRARIAELSDGPDNLDRMLLIEHRKRVVPPYGATGREQYSSRQERGGLCPAAQVGPPSCHCN